MLLPLSITDFAVRGQSFQCGQASESPRQTTPWNRNRATLDHWQL